MEKRNFKEMNIKSEKGFTMQDLVAAIIILVIFVGVLGTIMNAVYKINYKINMTSYATYYAILILEEIDKIPYENVQNYLATAYVNKFEIPRGFNVKLDVTNMADGTNKKDIIKKVKLTITYRLYGETEDLVIERYKIKEL